MVLEPAQLQVMLGAVRPPLYELSRALLACAQRRHESGGLVAALLFYSCHEV